MKQETLRTKSDYKKLVLDLQKSKTELKKLTKSGHVTKEMLEEFN